MKRFIRVVLPLLTLIILGLGPIGSTTVPVIGAGIAMAADPTPPVDPNAGCPSGSVKLSVPIFAGNDCVAPDANGGVITAYVVLLLRFVGGAIGGVIVLMIVIAGIQYIVSAGDPGAVKSARDRITNAITALVLFAFMYAILNFLIPGGIFS